jgi:hypothetical protein
MSQQAKPKRGSVVVLVALSIVLAGIGVRWFLNREPASSASAAPQPAPAASTPRPTAGTTAVKPGVSVTVPSLRSTNLRRDPFASKVVFPPKAVVDKSKPVEKPVDVNAEVVAAAKRELRLTAVLFGDNPVAVISGKTYRVGDAVGSFRVERIAPFEVVVEQRGVRVVLSKE